MSALPPEIAPYKGIIRQRIVRPYSKGDEHTHPSRQAKKTWHLPACLETLAAESQGIAVLPPLPQEKQGALVVVSLSKELTPLSKSRFLSWGCFFTASGTCHSMGRHLAFTVFSAQEAVCPPLSSSQVSSLGQGASVRLWFASLVTSACCPPEPVMNKAPPPLPREGTRCCRLRLFHLRTH